MFEERSFSKCKQHGIINDISIDFNTQKAKISLILDTKQLDIIEQLKNENKLNIELKKWYKRRSLDANAYCWVLCDEISKALTTEDAVVLKEDVYRDAISQIGTFQAMIVEEKAFEDFKRIWEKQGLGFIVQEVHKKDKCVKVHCYYGSSTYNTKEMSLLINVLVDLAKSLKIETKPQEELSSLLKEWEKN